MITYAPRNQPVNTSDAVEYDTWRGKTSACTILQIHHGLFSDLKFCFWSYTLAKVPKVLYLRLRQLLPERSHKGGFPREMVDWILNTATMVIKWTFLLISFKILIELKAIISPNIRLTNIEAGFLDLNELFLQP